jgi:HD superfamily phosphohydrolase
MDLTRVPHPWRLVVAKALLHPLVQRLHRVRQCGVLFELRSVTRYDHSVGTADLALRAACALRVRHPDLVAPRDVALVGLAGLLHDVGHGPLSHAFDRCAGVEPHEHRGARFVPVIVPTLEDSDIQFVQHCIDPLSFQRPAGYCAALAELVSCGTLGVDADRLDYVRRDAVVSGLAPLEPYSVTRIIDGLRIDPSRGLWVAPEAAVSVDALLATRRRLYERVYHEASAERLHAHAAGVIDRISRCGAASELVAAPGAPTASSLAAICADPGLFARLDDGCFDVAVRGRSEPARAAAGGFLVAHAAYTAARGDTL